MSTRENGCPRAVRAFVYEVERRANTKILRGSIMARPVGLVLEMQVQPGPSDAGARMDERVGKPSVHEPGAQGYGWLMRADGGRCHLEECDADAVAARFATRFMWLFMLAGCTVYRSLDAAVQAALSVLSPMSMGQAAGFHR